MKTVYGLFVLVLGTLLFRHGWDNMDEAAQDEFIRGMFKKLSADAEFSANLQRLKVVLREYL